MFAVGLSAQTNKIDSLKYNQSDEYVVPYDSLSPIDKLNYNFNNKYNKINILKLKIINYII